MRTLSSNKNMPSIQRKPTRKFKGLPILPQSTNPIFNEAYQLIFKIELLPLTFEFQTIQYKQLKLNLSNTSVSIKDAGQTCTIPLCLGKNKWMRIIFGHEVRNVEVKCNSTENKVEKNQIYTKYESWKVIFKEQNHNLYLQPLYLLLKNKNQKKDKFAEIPPKSSLTSFMKTRFSQRNNIKQNLIPLKGKNDAHSNITENQNFNISNNQHLTTEKSHQNSSTNKTESQRACSTLQIQKDSIKIHGYYNMKQSNTSTSISVEPELKFSKRLRRIRDIVDFKIVKSQKEVIFDDTSEIFQLKQRQKFYQHVNLSQQQIEIKRKKFDSQFICKKQILPILAKQNNNNIQKNQSEVTEDICKMQSSKHSNLFQDTFQKGYIGNKQNTGSLQQSGTLYESVYE